MLNTIKNNSLEDISDKCNIVKTINSYNKQQNSDRISTFFIPKSNIYVNYNKLKSKYNEKPTYLKKKLILNDKLFWCFYKLYNNITDSDLEYINTFTTEKNFKLSVIEKIKNNKDLLKKHKIQKNNVETEITNDKQISLTSFKTLCILYNLNIIVIKDNYTYTRFTNDNLESCIDNLDKYNAIKLIYKNSSTINTNFEIMMNIDKLELENALSKYYYVKNIEKPLKSLSSYKLDELIEIATKLQITINNDNNKKKTKLELYSECLKKLS
tara:strand:- start:6918 stop:7724 length:807 start_codon:yes stop_codon:yes gene_type:complete